jgi:Ser/Thr protein kinase RdoA (MazF antagonist)
MHAAQGLEFLTMTQVDSVVSHDQLLQLLQQSLGSRAELVDYHAGNLLHDYVVLLVRLRRPSIKVVVKLAGPEAPYPCPFERTAMLHRLVTARTTIPMPEVLAADTSYQSWPWRYFIKMYIPGQEWNAVRPRMDAEELPDAYHQMGNAVAQLHTLSFPRFGELDAAGNVAGYESWLPALAGRARQWIKSARSQDLFFTALDRRRQLFLSVCRANLCHEDLHRYNILFRRRQGRWHLSTLLDFDKAWAGHGESDLARLDLWTGMTHPAFWEAYAEVCPVDAGYAQRRPVYQLLWCLEYAQPTAKHLEDTRRVCAELGLPRFEGFA